MPVPVPPEAHYDEFENLKFHSREPEYKTKNRWPSTSRNDRIASANNSDIDYIEPKYDLGRFFYSQFPYEAHKNIKGDLFDIGIGKRNGQWWLGAWSGIWER